jgi:hypothetical protein
MLESSFLLGFSLFLLEPLAGLFVFMVLVASITLWTILGTVWVWPSWNEYGSNASCAPAQAIPYTDTYYSKHDAQALCAASCATSLLVSPHSLSLDRRLTVQMATLLYRQDMQYKRRLVK